MAAPRSIIIVTGANSGVGFGICQRLLAQLSCPSPSDALPQPALTSSSASSPSPFVPCSALTLIFACRSRSRAEDARTKLLDLLEAELELQRTQDGYDGHGDKFKKNLVIDIAVLDLASVESTFNFCDHILQTYPYITHLISNAGVSPLAGYNWPLAIYRLTVNYVDALTHPDFYKQHKGLMTDDRLGWTWQCNVFGHYIIARNLAPLFARVPQPLQPARVLWTSSFHMDAKKFDLQDLQLTRSPVSYELSKYQIDLIAYTLTNRTESANVRHFIVHPAITATDIVPLNWLMTYLKLLAMYLARLLGSPHHPIKPFYGAIAACHLALVSLFFVPPPSEPVKYGSRVVGLWGEPYVGVDPIPEWSDERKMDGEKLVGKLEELRVTYERRRAAQ